MADGLWMLKRSEHLKRWKRRWFQADASGDIVEIRGDKAEAKTRSTISLADVRSATVSSTNFHGDPIEGLLRLPRAGTPWRAVFPSRTRQRKPTLS